MQTVQITWKSSTSTGLWIGVKYPKGDFFVKSTIECTAQEVFDSLEVGTEVDVPRDVL